MADNFFDDLDSISTAAEAEHETSRDVETGLLKLAALVEDLNRELSTATILDRAMAAAIELTGAERGFLVLISEKGDWTFRVARNMESGEIADAEHAASHTVLQKVIGGRQPILINDVVGASDLTKHQSIAKMQVRSIMGAPLISKGKLLGAAYVDTSRLAGVFDQTSLVLFQSFVQLAAVALENARLIEAEHEATARYREMQEYLGVVLGSQPHGVIILDGSQGVEYANRQAMALLKGCDLRPGMPISDAALRLGGIGDTLLSDLKAFMQQGISRHATFALGATTLAYSFFPVHRAPVGGQRVGIIIEDITAQKQLERRLIESEKRSTVNQLAGGIAHEINNSLQPVKGRVELLAMRLRRAGISMEGGIDKDLETISQLSDRIEKIARNLRHLTKPASPAFHQVNLSKLLHSTMELMETTTGMLRGFSHGDSPSAFHLLIDLADDLPPITGDEHALESAFINAILNSCHAIREAGRGTLAIRAHPTDSGIVVKIEDTGGGIPPDVLPHVFEPYYTTRGETGGTGLGMCIIQNVAEIHGAKLDLQSTFGEGTRLTLTFPLLQSDAALLT